MNTLKNSLNTAMTKAYIKIRRNADRLQETLKDESGQFVMDHSVVFVIIIVLAALALVLLKDWLKDTLAPTLQSKIMEFFN